MSTIQATVNARLLSKASRLFTGTLAGRIIEILQNARRAGAEHVQITNSQGIVTVRDDGRGIDDFSKLLDLGGSGWGDGLEASEDPAGVGLFCLAPRRLSIRSNGWALTIDAEAWEGRPVEVAKDPCDNGIQGAIGTELSFADEPWTVQAVEPMAVFTGMRVNVDSVPCARQRFIDASCFKCPALGCRIQVAAGAELTDWHRRAVRPSPYGANVLLNFHGQVVALAHHPVTGHDLHYLVDMTGQPTGIRLMLPARTCLVENDALAQLQAALELEAFRYLQRQGRHRLPYREYLRARELGIELGESDPVFRVGLLYEDPGPAPIEVTMPKDHALARCYRASCAPGGDESDQANIHLLAALGHFESPFVPVAIDGRYDGYAWSKVPTVDRVGVSVGPKLHESWVGRGQLICVESIVIGASCSGGQIHRSPVCMAVKPPDGRRENSWFGDAQVYVTPEARRRLDSTQIWFHLGGYNEEGDSYDTQEHQFRQQLGEFWLRLLGPDEPLRAQLVQALCDLKRGWRSVTILRNGRVTIRQANAKTRTILPPHGRLRRKALS
jgi:hypothetical protein